MNKSRAGKQEWGNSSFLLSVSLKYHADVIAGRQIGGPKEHMNFVNKTINPPCDRLLATFVELNSEILSKRVFSCLKTSVLPNRTLNHLLGQPLLKFPLPFSFLMPLKTKTVKRGEESPLGVPEWPVEDVCEPEAGTEVDMEDETIYAVGGVGEIGFSGYQFEGFTLSEIPRRKRMSKRRMSDGVVDTSNLPQCEFSNLQHLSLSFLPEIFSWPVFEFF